MDHIQEQDKSIVDVLEELFQNPDESLFRNALIDLHPADIAEAVSRLDEDVRNIIFNSLDNEKASEVLAELDPPVLNGVLPQIAESRLVEIIDSLESDDAADIIGELDTDLAQRIMAAMPWKSFRNVETLLRHDEDTAGGIMALEIVAVEEDKTAKEALKELRKKAEEVDDVYNIYVIDSYGKLVGRIALKDLVLSSPKSILSDIMIKEPIAVVEDMDQEEVAQIFSKYDLISAPVINTSGRLVGRITVDDVLQVVEEEASEDITKMAGITDEELGERSILKVSSVRLPWLLVGFAGQMLSARILNHYMPDANGLIMATLFIPLIMAMAGNIGIQSSTVIVRGLAIGDIRLNDTWWRLFQEISVAFLNGTIIALLLFGVVTFWFKQMRFGVVLSIALLIVLIMAGTIGTLVPLILKRLKVDPAIATGPFITTSNDVLGLIIYYSIVNSFAGL